MYDSYRKYSNITSVNVADIGCDAAAASSDAVTIGDLLN